MSGGRQEEGREGGRGAGIAASEEELGAALMGLTVFVKKGWRGLLLHVGAATCFMRMFVM